MRVPFDDDEPRKFFGPQDNNAGGGPTPPPRLENPISADTAEQLMSIVGVSRLFDAWKQGFFFGSQPYGLHQVAGGPCGVIATVQAFLLRALLERGQTSTSCVLDVSEVTRAEALADALCDILWKNAGDGRRATILVPSAANAMPVTAAQMRCLQPANFVSYDQLRRCMMQRPFRDLFFNPSGFGVALFLYSLIATRGVVNIQGDVDDPKASGMIGDHGYCTQELVNLMVFGRAYSNVFDGTKRLGNAKDGFCALQGAPKRAPVGFLSLFEAFNCMQVGSRYKSPVCPVWIICAESHYTCLFALDPVDPRDETRPIDVWYFDQFARQAEPIKLTVQPNDLPAGLTSGFEESESMIDRCIRTKWKDASIDWNGSEPIL